jgi:hypothetical protein
VIKNERFINKDLLNYFIIFEVKMTIVQDVKSAQALSAYVVAPFDQAFKELSAEGYKLISLQQNARLRIEQGKDAVVSRKGNWVREGAIYIPGASHVLFVRESPVLEMPEQATQAHRQGKEVYITSGQLVKAEQSSIKIPYGQKNIPTERFKDEALPVWAFGDKAEDYGNFLREADIIKVNFLLICKGFVDKQTGPFSYQIWFEDIGSGFSLNGRTDLIFNCCNTSRGVRGDVVATSAEGMQKNLEDRVTLTQLRESAGKAQPSEVCHKEYIIEKYRKI